MSDTRLWTLRVTVHVAGAAGLVVLFLAAWWTLLRPIKQQQYLAHQRMTQLETTLAAIGDIRSENASLTERLAAVRDREASLHARVPDDPAEAEFLALASKLATDAGLRIKDYRPGKATEGPSCSSLEVALICEGNYASICQFVDGMSELPRLSTVKSLHVDATKNDKDYHVELSILLYYGAVADPAEQGRGGPHA